MEGNDWFISQSQYHDCYWPGDARGQYFSGHVVDIGLLPDTQNYGLRMCRVCRERFPRHWLQRKPLVSGPDMHYGTCVTHVPWCTSGSLTRSGGKNVPGLLFNKNFKIPDDSQLCPLTGYKVCTCFSHCQSFWNNYYWYKHAKDNMFKV